MTMRDRGDYEPMPAEFFVPAEQQFDGGEPVPEGEEQSLGHHYVKILSKLTREAWSRGQAVGRDVKVFRVDRNEVTDRLHVGCRLEWNGMSYEIDAVTPTPHAYGEIEIMATARFGHGGT